MVEANFGNHYGALVPDLDGTFDLEAVLKELPLMAPGNVSAMEGDWNLNTRVTIVVTKHGIGS